jgi:hypothetical protein
MYKKYISAFGKKVRLTKYPIQFLELSHYLLFSENYQGEKAQVM